MGGDGARVAYPLFQEEDGGANPTSPLQLNIFQISARRAVNLNRQWHSVLPEITNPQGDGIYFAAEWCGKLYACAIWTMPISRAFNGKNYLELRRMAICKEAPKNTASRMLSVMAKIIKNKKPHIVKLISYQDTAIHKGTIYKASGWKQATKNIRLGSWGNKGSWNYQDGKCSRKRNIPQTTSIKIRWEKEL